MGENELDLCALKGTAIESFRTYDKHWGFMKFVECFD
jgi:hypothetical protein